MYVRVEKVEQKMNYGVRKLPTWQINWGMLKMLNFQTASQYIFAVFFEMERIPGKDLKIIYQNMHMYYRVQGRIMELQGHKVFSFTFIFIIFSFVLWKKDVNFASVHGMCFYVFFCCSHSSKILSPPLLRNTDNTHKLHAESFICILQTINTDSLTNVQEGHNLLRYSLKQERKEKNY